MILIGNNGIEIREENREGEVFYICNNGAEFSFTPDKNPNIIGNNGIELFYDEDNNKVISNNGNDAIVKTSGNIINIVFLNGVILVGVTGDTAEYGKLDMTTFDNFVLA